MDISIDTQTLQKALDAKDGLISKNAYLADLAPDTLKSVLSGNPTVKVESIAKAADYLGFKTVISFVPKNGTGINVNVTPFDDSTAIKEYARRYLDDGYLGLSFDEAADQVASDLIDPSAAMRFKQEVRRMRKNARSS